MNSHSNNFLHEAAAAVAASHPMTRKDALDIASFMLGMSLVLSTLVALL